MLSKVSDCPWIFMHHRMIDTLHHAWLENLVPHDFPYGMEAFYRIGDAAISDAP